MQKSLDEKKHLPMKSTSTRAHAWLIWFLAAAFYMYENVLQVSPGVMVPDLMSAFSINSAALGGLIAFFFYSYAGMQIPVGILVDNYNARFLLTAATLSCVLGCILFGLATHFYMASLGRFLIGLGAAFAAVCSMKLAANWFQPKQFSLLVGLMVTMGMLGSMMGEKPLALLVELVGWRHTLLLLAGIGAFLAILIVLFIKHAPDTPNNSIKLQNAPIKTHSLLHGLLCVLRCKQSFLVAVYGGLMFASTSIFGGLWGVPFLMKAYMLDRPTAAGIVSIMFFGWVVGGPLSGILVNLISSHKKVLWLSSIGSFIIILGILYQTHLSLLHLSILIFGFGVFSSFFLPSFTLMHNLHSDGNSGAALGFMNTANMLGGVIGQPLIGILLDLTWNGTIENGARVYTTANYQYSLTCLPIIIAISLILIPFLKEQSHKV